MFRNSVLTRDNLAKRNWKGKDKNCSFCDYPETVEHLFCTCIVAKFVWGMVRSITGIHDIPCKIEEFSDWVEKFPKKLRQVIAVGVAATKSKTLPFFIMFTRMTLVFCSFKFLIGYHKKGGQ